MYVGRIVAIGRSEERSFAAYRVSSRSFPNRRAEIRGRSILVSPLNPADLARNPYIAYNCIRVGAATAVVANGTQADMIMERIDDGQKPLDALAVSLVAYGYERDELDTPRIAGVVRGKMGWLGIARKEEFRVRQFELKEGEAYMVATYEKTDFEAMALGGPSAEEIARRAYDLPLERPVCAAAALETSGEQDTDFDLSVYNPE